MKKALADAEYGPQKARGLFFDFICKVLKHFNTGIIESDFRKFGKPDEQLPDSPDHSYLFNKQRFLNLYRNNRGVSYESDRECYQFLQDLVDRQIFQSLIERWVEADAQVGIYLFKKRLDQLEDSSLQ